MSERKNKLPNNSFKRMSRKRHRGREYYFNSTAKNKSWNHPAKQFARNSVAEWLNRSDRDTARDTHFLPPMTVNLPSVEIQYDSQCTNHSVFSRHLEAEYRKFEEALALIEKEADVDSAFQSSAYSLYEETNGSLVDPITYADDKPIHGVSSLRHSEYMAPLIGRSFHVIIDTTIFLNEMTFLKHLLNKIDEVPGQPMIVIPYAVLQKLDELKLLTAKASSTQAMHAIEFISQQLKTKPNYICGQSGMDNGIQFNEKDSIINCCLQLKQNCGVHVVLLTNDISLSNLAICSQIEVYNRNELEATLFRLAEGKDVRYM